MKHEKPVTDRLSSRSEAPVSVVAASDDTGADSLVTRTEAASLLGASVSTLRRRDQELRPIVDEDGIHRYSVRRITEYKLEHTQAKAKSSSAGVDGALAAAGFEHFDRGLGPADVVKLLRTEPSLARQLFQEWADLRGSFVVFGKAAVEIEKLAVACDDGPVQSGEDLLRILEQIERLECACCTRRPWLCMRCYVHRPPRAQKLAAAALAGSEARQGARYQKDVERHAARRARERSGRDDGATS